MMARQVTEVSQSMVEQLQSLGNQFYRHVGLGGTFHADTFVENWNKLLNSGIAMMWITETCGVMTGVMGVILSMHMFDGILTAQECFWFVDPEFRGTAGVRLFHEFEKWAKELKVQRLLVAHIDQVDGGVDKFYTYHKFRKLETVYVKETTW